MNEPWGLPVAVPGVVGGVLDAVGLPANATGATGGIPDGYVGTIINGAGKVGTGGRTYSTISATSFGLADTLTANITLNKGIYFATAIFFGVNPDAGTRRLFVSMRIGGTAVLGQYIQSVVASEEVTMTLSMPLIITANGTVLGCYAQTSAASAMNSCQTELFVHRIG